MNTALLSTNRQHLCCLLLTQQSLKFKILWYFLLDKEELEYIHIPWSKKKKIKDCFLQMGTACNRSEAQCWFSLPNVYIKKKKSNNFTILFCLLWHKCYTIKLPPRPPPVLLMHQHILSCFTCLYKALLCLRVSPWRPGALSYSYLKHKEGLLTC